MAESSRGHRGVVIAGAVAVVAMLAIGIAVASTSDSSTTSGASGSAVTRTSLGEAVPVNAPGNTLYLQQVTIAPGAALPEHFHQGTQVAHIISGTLTYNIVSGTAVVTRTDGTVERATGPKTVMLAPGESVIEDASLTHFGANDGSVPVVIELAALLGNGAPLATTTGTAATGTPIHLTANLDSQDRNLAMAGPNDSFVYGWNHLVGTATQDGQPVKVDLLGAVNYTSGNGPFSGFVTFTFADGSTLGTSMQGQTIADPDTSDATFNATLGVIGGTGPYETARGTGTFLGTRTAALGTTVAATFDLVVST